MTDVHVVVLAAGKGTRMKSSMPKVAHRIAGVPMIEYVVETAERLSPRSTTIVVGYHANAVKDALARRSGLTFVVQEPQLGTAHALLTAEQGPRRRIDEQNAPGRVGQHEAFLRVVKDARELFLLLLKRAKQD